MRYQVKLEICSEALRIELLRSHVATCCLSCGLLFFTWRFRCLLLLVNLLLDFLFLLLCFLLKLGYFLGQYIQLIGLFLLDLCIIHLRGILCCCTELSSMAFIDKRFDHARIASEEDLTTSCTGHVSDRDPRYNFRVFRLKDDIRLT